MKSAIHGLYVITDTAIQNRFPHPALAEMAIHGGADLIQLRDKKLSTRQLLETALAIQALCKKADIPFLVNDRVDIALLANADGVHLGQDDLPIPEARKLLGPKKIIGRTAGTLEQALQVEREGADYIGFGHIFPTRTKPKSTPPQGLENLRTVCASVKIPVIAVGGIDPSNLESVLEAHPAGVAVTSAVCASLAPEQATRILKAIDVASRHKAH